MLKKEIVFNRLLNGGMIGMVLIILIAGIYAYGTSNPNFVGHSLGEIEGGIWNKSGNNVFYTEGNVGIGTNNPQAELDIDGGVRLKNLLNCEYLYTDENGDLKCISGLPENVNKKYIGTTFGTGFTSSGIYRERGCVNVEIDCSTGDPCTIKWKKIGYGGDTVNFRSTTITKGQTVSSPVYYSPTAGSDMSCVVQWQNDPINKIRVYGKKWNVGNYWTYESNGYLQNEVIWYVL